MATPTDPLYAKQWHLQMIGNLRRVWDDYSGRGVTVAVYDDGLQASHGDLAANYDASQHFRFNGRTYAPIPKDATAGHGTACAGLIAAVDNNGRGGTGVAHGATLTGLDYLNELQFAYDWGTQTSSALYTAAMRWAGNFDIMSNSWGTDPDYSDELNLNIAGNGSAVDAGHFAWVSANGRDGLGTIVVKAAGNETMNANGDGSNVSRHTITVAATERNGFVAGYSNFGSSILLTAPAASVTTDLTGGRGYSAGDYTTGFGGTSAATPVVAGVVALMLEAAPDLGWRDVQSILTLSAAHTGGGLGGGARGHEVGGWLTMGGDQWNGGGAIYHLSYGFGMVDAFAAVRMAEVWSRLNPAAGTSANEVHLASVYGGADLRIADSDRNTTTTEARIEFTVAQDVLIDSVQVTLDITHSYASDLVIFLRGPEGQKIALIRREGGSDAMDRGLEWTFAAEAFRGMSSQGTWKLLFHDQSSGDRGVIHDARLDFYGSSSSIDDVYHFTDDFRMLRNLQADRRVIVDGDGGTDWLNFAAMSGNLSVNMAAGGLIKVNGVYLARLAKDATEFERLQAGDGRDALTGNLLANQMFGGRGDDRITGRGGDDHLRGERGNDTLKGGAGQDVLTGGRGSDVFVFMGNFGTDLVTDWADNVDRLHLDQTIWGGGMSVAQVISTFGEVVAGSVVLSFSAAQVITLQGFGNLNALANDITLI